MGDVRQSIYRFRGAEPEIIDRWRERFPEPGRKSLTESFRSVPAIIHFINALFAEHFAAGRSGETPEGLDEHCLVPVREKLNDEPAVAFVWATPPDAAEPEADASRPAAVERRENKARLLARWLRQRIDAGWTVLHRQTQAQTRARR